MKKSVIAMILLSLTVITSCTVQNSTIKDNTILDPGNKETGLSDVYIAAIDVLLEEDPGLNSDIIFVAI